MKQLHMTFPFFVSTLPPQKRILADSYFFFVLPAAAAAPRLSFLIFVCGQMEL